MLNNTLHQQVLIKGGSKNSRGLSFRGACLHEADASFRRRQAERPARRTNNVLWQAGEKSRFFLSMSRAKHPSDRQNKERDSSLPPDRWSKTLRAGRSLGLRLVENDIDLLIFRTPLNSIMVCSRGKSFETDHSCHK